MLSKNDYSQLSIEELLIEEKKVKKNGTVSSVLIGLLIGVMIYSIVKNGFSFLPLVLPLFLIIAVFRNSQIQKQNLEQIQVEVGVKKMK